MDKFFQRNHWDKLSRRSFLAGTAGAFSIEMLLKNQIAADEVPKVIPGFDDLKTTISETQKWEKFTDRKIRMGIIGYGVCRFGSAFSFQNHPNVDIIAVSDLFPDRCAGLSKDCRCEKTYPSLEELLKDDSVEAVFLATDARGHADHAIKALKAGKHVAVAVPAVLGSLEDADRLFETVKQTGLTYMMFETSAYRDDAYAARIIYQAGGFGKMVYSEGEYYHYYGEPFPSYNGWRTGLPPLYYPTHAAGYYTCVTGNSFTKVSACGNRGIVPQYQPKNNEYENPFGTELALMHTSEGGMARIIVSRDTAGGSSVESGRHRGQLGIFTDGKFQTYDQKLQAKMDLLPLLKPALPPGVEPGVHGGSHGYLMTEFIDALLRNRKPLIDIGVALNTVVCGIVAHQSALKDGELLKIPQYHLD